MTPYLPGAFAYLAFSSSSSFQSRARSLEICTAEILKHVPLPDAKRILRRFSYSRSASSICHRVGHLIMVSLEPSINLCYGSLRKNLDAMNLALRHISSRRTPGKFGIRPYKEEDWVRLRTRRLKPLSRATSRPSTRRTPEPLLFPTLELSEGY